MLAIINPAFFAAWSGGNFRYSPETTSFCLQISSSEIRSLGNFRPGMCAMNSTQAPIRYTEKKRRAKVIHVSLTQLQIHGLSYRHLKAPLKAQMT